MGPGSRRAGELAKETRSPRWLLVRSAVLLVGLFLSRSAFAQSPQQDDCSRNARKILSDIRISFLAKEGEIYLHSARRSFAESPPGCASGLWFLAAARLLREPGQTSPLEGGGLVLESAKQALERGLAAGPREPQLLTFVAYLSAVSPADSPPLPEEACARLLGDGGVPQDLKSYVCGHLALRKKEYAEAEKSFEPIQGSYSFPDAALRRAEALLGLGRKAEARKAAALALDILQPGSLLIYAFGASDSEVRALRARASEIAASR
jgi:hypothetical protein